MTYQENQDFPTNSHSVTVWSGSVDALVAATEQPGLPSAMESTLEFLAEKTDVSVVAMLGRHLGPLVNQKLHASTLFAIWLPGDWVDELPTYAAVEEPRIINVKTTDLMNNYTCLGFPGHHRQLNIPTNVSLYRPLIGSPDKNGAGPVLFLFVGGDAASLVIIELDAEFIGGMQGAGNQTGDNYRPYGEHTEEERAMAQLAADEYKKGPPDPEWHIADWYQINERS